MTHSETDTTYTGAIAEHWQQGADRRQQALIQATHQMLDAAQITEGNFVLDLAAGTGEQSRLAALRVGASGTILATDISPNMLEIAAKLSQDAGLSTIQTRVINAEQIDLPDASVDAVICRFGLMIIPQLQQALSEIKRVLKPGGKVSALVWSRPEQNPFFRFFAVNAISAIKQLEEATPRTTDPFALSDPAFFAKTLTEAGFKQAYTQAIPFHLTYPSLEAFLQSSQRKPPAFLAKKLDPQKQAERLEETKKMLRQYEGPDGLKLPGEALLGVGTKA